MNVAAWVKSNRAACGWTQNALGFRVGVDGGSVSRWERGNCNPNLEQFRLLCVEFDSSADEALGLPERLRVRPKRRSKRAVGAEASA